ncbi:MAG: hypothetical protein KGY76_05865 [Candidatus Thermoplasmatota archaeon]|nr:hypothetical protein [Candidatus Thermoplasmatota archaeon]
MNPGESSVTTQRKSTSRVQDRRKTKRKMIAGVVLLSLLISGLGFTVSSEPKVDEKTDAFKENGGPKIIRSYSDPNYPMGHEDENLNNGTGGSMIDILAEVENSSSITLSYEWCFGGICRPGENNLEMSNVEGDLYRVSLDGSAAGASKDGSFPADSYIEYVINVTGSSGKDYAEKWYKQWVYYPPGSANISASSSTEIFSSSPFKVNGSIRYDCTNGTGEHAKMENSVVRLEYGDEKWYTRTGKLGNFSKEIIAPPSSGKYLLNITVENETWDVKSHWEDPITVKKLNLSFTSHLNLTTCLPEDALRINGSATLNSGDIPEGADVSIRINKSEWITKIDPTGNFFMNITAPSSPGNYTVNVTVTSETYNLSKQKSLDLTVEKTQRAEIIVQSVEVSPDKSEIYENESFQIVSSLDNVGSGGAEFEAAFAVNSKENIRAVESVVLSSGASTTIRFNWSAKPGNYTIWVIAGHNESLEDSPEGNSRSLDITVMPKTPEILLGNITIVNTGDILEEENVNLQLRVNNSGKARAVFQLALAVDREENYTRWSSVKVETGSSITVQFNWSARAGRHTLWVIPDPNASLGDHFVVQKRKKIVSVEKKRAEIVVKDLGVYPKNKIEVNERVYVTATVFNQGNAPASFVVALAVDFRENVTDKTNLSLQPGEQKEVNLSWECSSDRHKVWLISDHDRTVDEQIESDNTAATIVETTPTSAGDDGTGEEEESSDLMRKGDIIFAAVIILFILAGTGFLLKKRELKDKEKESEEENDED